MRFLRLPYCMYAFVTFMVLMLLIFPLVILASCFGKLKGGNYIYWLCRFWADAWFFLIGIRHQNIFESPHDRHKQYIFVANHISYIDAPVIFKTLRRKIRILGKAELSKVPLFGFIYRNAVVTVDRNSPAHRAQSVRALKAVIKKGVSIFIFPEGTFNETHQPLKDMYDGAFRIAIETQTPIKPLLFLDSYHRLHYQSIFFLNPGRSRSVFLQEIPVHDLTVKDVEILKQKVYSIMDQKLREYKAGWIV